MRQRARRVQKATWQSSGAAHTTGCDAVQTPPRHMSVLVQSLPSSQVAPSCLAGFEQTPVAGSQVPAV
jgi:hypothetical protein